MCERIYFQIAGTDPVAEDLEESALVTECQDSSPGFQKARASLGLGAS